MAVHALEHFPQPIIDPEGIEAIQNLASAENLVNIDQAPLPEYPGLEVIEHKRSVRSVKVEGTPGQLDRFRFSDGSRHEALILLPRSQKFDIPLTFTTPWCTDIPGFNSYVAGKYAAAGMGVVLVGPDKKLGRHSLSHDAYVHNKVLDEIDEEGYFTPRQVTTVGYSRGAMVGFGVQAYGQQVERRSPYNEYLDPCMPRAVQNGDLLPTLQLTAYLIKEALSLGSNMVRWHRIKSLLELPRSMPIDPVSLINRIYTFVELKKGETGLLASHLPKNSATRIALFQGSYFNNRDVWQQMFREQLQVTIIEQPGFHMDGVNRQMIAESVGRVTTALCKLRDGASPKELL